MAGPDTKVMQQHLAAKRAFPDAIVFFRLGDFYEMFGEDAVVAARVLELTLTSRNKGKPDEIPMAGVPHHAAHGYIARLLAQGHKVAICEQMADPTKVKGIVPREVVRVITPGLVTDGDQLEASSNNWLAAIDAHRDGVGIALLDLSTGELLAAEVPDLLALLGELARSEPREILVGRGITLDEGADGEDELERAIGAVRAAVPRAVVRTDVALGVDRIADVLGDLASEASDLPAFARRAVARVVRFARACNPGRDLALRRVGRWDPRQFLVLDATSQAHLELTESNAGGRAGTLLGVIDATTTPAGARLLRRRLLAPLVDVERIRRRLDAVEAMVCHARLRSDLRGALAQVGDLERLAMRATLREATPRDLGALRDGLTAAACAVAVVDAVHDPDVREALRVDREPLDTVDDLAAELTRALVERPPSLAKEGAIFLGDYDQELAELDRLKRSGTERMVELEAELRDANGIPSLKVRYTRVFGWYIEVTRAHVSRVPPDWRRKQTIAAGERYTNPEVDDLADRVLHAAERYRERELELLAGLVERAAAVAPRIQAVAARLARWDVASGLAEVAHRCDYSRPTVDSTDLLSIEDGRHPVVERRAAAGRFVPNDVRQDLAGERLWLVTGPNMAGKSTILRQTALIVILAQMGSYVPARAVRLGLVDRVLSRVGASDNLAGGESTFMVEMRETAAILRSATRRSLVILDEIGRGTSTFDGLAIAWAVAEHLDEVIGCRTLFATHYHELTSLADVSAHAANYSVSARELGDDIVFLHRLVPGAVSRSYGVAVARLAGLPESVLARARAVLASLEGEGMVTAGSAPASTPPRRRRAAQNQLDLFAAPDVPSASQREVLDTLRSVEVDRMSPLDALSLVVRLQQKLRS
ncbi:MAG: DNA mismatch repair protein MutS [Polyangiaceae bacterium]|nr:DNA mismatch repair protein MutS [Polyangiaceae bacterium]